MAALRYALRTRRVTYVLDDTGVCQRVIVSERSSRSRAEACVGAQFVACLDLTARGGLVGDLRVGAAALFVRPDATGRVVLMRTTTLRAIELLGSTGGTTNTTSVSDARTTRTQEITSIVELTFDGSAESPAAVSPKPLPAYPAPPPTRKSSRRA